MKQENIIESIKEIMFKNNLDCSELLRYTRRYIPGSGISTGINSIRSRGTKFIDQFFFFYLLAKKAPIHPRAKTTGLSWRAFVKPFIKRLLRKNISKRSSNNLMILRTNRRKINNKKLTKFLIHFE